MKILLLVPYPLNSAPSQRFRFEQYVPELAKHGFEVHAQPFLDDEAWLDFYEKGGFYKKTKAIISGLISRYRTLAYIRQYSFVFVHRETSPVGPGLFDRLLCGVFR
ncbi:MAG: glycosyltransferase family 1 protein, partial [Flavobacteriales bacterium]|nr:glycosyltransferase family 1 protein [Flavobacteriales bacterium]